MFPLARSLQLHSPKSTHTGICLEKHPICAINIGSGFWCFVLILSRPRMLFLADHAVPPKKPPRPGAPGHAGSAACLNTADSYNEGVKVQTPSSCTRTRDTQINTHKQSSQSILLLIVLQNSFVQGVTAVSRLYKSLYIC